MNIFALSDSPVESAIWQHDRHVVKMILESAQMLSTSAPDILPPQFASHAYKSTHMNHPCNVWVRESLHNAAWLIIHGNALVAEYHRRFQRVHATYTLLQGFLNGLQQRLDIPRMVASGHFADAALDFASQHTPFAVCMPDDCKLDSTKYRDSEIQSYQRLYLFDKLFQDHVKWTRCDSLPAFILKAREGMVTNSVTRARINELEAANVAQRSEAPRVVSTYVHSSRPAYNPAEDSRPTLKVIKRFGA